MDDIVKKDGDNKSADISNKSTEVTETNTEGRQQAAPSNALKPSMTTIAPAIIVRDWKRPAALGYALIIFTFFILGGWSAFAKLDSAVTAPGIVAVENSRKAVQHLEGGIIQQILVQEGQHVTAGQVLFRLDPTPAQASRDLQQNQIYALWAQEARLLAERDKLNTIVWPKELMQVDHPMVHQAMSDQTKQFADRRASLHGQTDLLESRIDQFKTEIDGLKVEREATQQQLQYINQELKDLEYLLSEKLVQKSRVFALQREKSRLEGIIGRSVTDEGKAQTGISEAQLQIQQVQHKFDEDVASAILDVRQKINDTREKISVAKDVFKRLDITAPVSGTLQSLKVFTVGGVIRPGEVLAEIVPDADALIIQAHVSPQDVDRMWPGMKAEVRFSSFKASLIPIIMGRVTSVSRDRLVDEANHQAYFLAQVVAESIPEDLRDRLVAGMPAELVFPTGERTVLNYLIRPMQDRMNGAFRER